jgi:hypothetical protein
MRGCINIWTPTYAHGSDKTFQPSVHHNPTDPTVRTLGLGLVLEKASTVLGGQAIVDLNESFCNPKWCNLPPVEDITSCNPCPVMGSVRNHDRQRRKPITSQPLISAVNAARSGRLYETHWLLVTGGPNAF